MKTRLHYIYFNDSMMLSRLFDFFFKSKTLEFIFKLYFEFYLTANRKDLKFSYKILNALMLNKAARGLRFF